MIQNTVIATHFLTSGNFMLYYRLNYIETIILTSGLQHQPISPYSSKPLDIFLSKSNQDSSKSFGKSEDFKRYVFTLESGFKVYENYFDEYIDNWSTRTRMIQPKEAIEFLEHIKSYIEKNPNKVELKLLAQKAEQQYLIDFTPLPLERKG